MRSIFLLLFFFAFNNLFAQEVQARFDQLNNETRGRSDSYLASDGAVYKVGDRITLGDPFVDCSQIYSFIRNTGSETATTAMLKGLQMKVQRIRIEGTERMGYYATLYLEGIDVFQLCEVQLEKAISSGEIICLGMTEEKALEQLRKAKEKLDLQLITQDEYTSLLNELSKYIK